MSAINWDDVVAFAPDLSVTELAVQLYVLDYVNTAINVVEFGGEDSSSLRLARIYLAAHHGTIILQSGSGGAGAFASGPVTSESAGGLSRSYGGVGGSSSAGTSLDSTTHGRTFMLLARSSAARAPVLI